VLVQRETERGRSPLLSIPPFGPAFSRHRGLTDPMKVGAAQGGDPRAAVHRLNEATKLPFSMVASPQCRFRFAPGKIIVGPPRLGRPTSGWLVIQEFLESLVPFEASFVPSFALQNCESEQL
jgi:hypothetical protein